VTSLAVDPVEARLAAALVRLAEREGSAGAGGARLPPMTRQSLADMTGTTVETTIRTLGRWLKRGLLVERDGQLRVPDIDALRTVAEGEDA
jgi:CRP/FNR family transcriptional regulator